MKKSIALLRTLWKPLIGVLVLGFLVVWSGGFLEQKVGSTSVPHLPGRPLPEGAALADVERQSVAPRIDIVGSTESGHTVQVMPRLNAYLTEVLASAGDRVKAGQVLAQLDDRELVEQMATAQARFTQVEADYKRATQLFQRSASTDQAMQASEAGYQSAKAALEQARVSLGYAQVKAPMDGVITERLAEVGDLAHPGRVLFGLYDPLSMRLVAPVPMRLADRLALGQRVETSLDYPPRTLTAEVTEIVSEVDARSRTRKVKLRYEQQPGDILPGAFGRLLLDDEAKDTVLIPRAAVRRIGQLEQVEVAAGDRLTLRLVKTGSAYGDRVEVLSGLEPGERVLVRTERE